MSNNQRWEQFTVLESDLDYLANFLVETEKPSTLDALAHELTVHRYEQLTSMVEDTLAQGRTYRPGEVYHVDETVVFPHLSNLTGKVTSVRVGRNPEFDPFSVIRVRTVDGLEREFAAELTQPHPLNSASYLPDDEVSADTVYGIHGEGIRNKLLRALGISKQFVTVGEKWFIRDLLVDISPGQVNICEAVLDMAAGGPVATPALLAEIDLPAEVTEPLRLFSLERALLHDSRFDEVGPAGQVVWYLRDLEPTEVLETPALLRYQPIPYNRQVLDESMLSLETQAADEWSEVTGSLGAGRATPSDSPVTIVLNYPHWRSGTLPLALHVANFFPTARITDRIRFSFVDDESGEEFPGWVVRGGRYVYGLSDWYKANGVIAGSFVDLSRGDEPGQIRIGTRSIRSQRREWLRTVTSEGDNLIFEVTRVPVSCEFDELAAVAVDSPKEIDALRGRFARASLESLLDRAFGGLAGLSLQRAVHAMTLYSVLNLIRRVPPAPMLAALAVSPKYMSLGDNYWAYQGEE
ncbi:MAG: hypothetical protein E4H01_12745 [Lysobacterales bacterium]|nr:MAG: hypothetical protein E4H01_12745 [Xanthomonadales bacterium]